MFSATFNKECREVARKFLSNDHVRIRIGRAGSAHMNVKQQVYISKYPYSCKLFLTLMYIRSSMLKIA